MCINLPVKIVSVDKRIVAEIGDRKKELAGSLIKIKKGDYVYLQNNFIVHKIPKKQAEQVINLINNK